MQSSIVRTGSILKDALGNDLKGKISPVVYLLGVGAAFVSPHISEVLYGIVALMWIVPDRRIEARLAEE